ncbi:hypothetical protein LZ31DRAFT_549423 [Colletotrichum somersetense]|nr:hypothetical protein LZ31DRAFT_549423 [Colletotrichum somersetense]
MQFSTYSLALFLGAAAMVAAAPNSPSQLVGLGPRDTIGGCCCPGSGGACNCYYGKQGGPSTCSKNCGFCT